MKKNLLFQKRSFRFKRFQKKSYSAYNSMHKVVTIGVLSIAAIASTSCKTANAQTVNSDTVQMYGQLDEITIEDDLASPLNQAGKVVTVITRQEIENLKAQSVAELLTLCSAIDVQQRGAHSVQADISLRGGNFDQTAVLLNGINITNPHTGHYSLDIPICISDIEKIEIIKGPSAIIYGACAFSGGINIITKKNIDKSLNVLLEGGEHGFFNTEISTAKKYKNTENYLSLGFKNSEGYIANSDYNIYNLMYQSRVNFSKHNMLDFQVGYNKKDYGANTFYSAKYPNQYEKTSAFLSSLKAHLQIAENFVFVPSAYFSTHKDEFFLIKNVSSPNLHRSNVCGNNVTFQYRNNALQINFGSDVRFEEVLSTVLGQPSDWHLSHYNHYDGRINFSYFIQASYTLKKVLLTAGLISFQNTSFSQNPLTTYPSLNINYQPAKNWELFASFNTSSRLPSFTELYYKDAVHQANPLLKQEKSTSCEFGVKNLNRIIVSSVNAFYMWGEDMIDWVKDSASQAQWQCRNISKLNKYGIDIDEKVFLKEIFPALHTNTTLQISYSYIHQSQAKTPYISQYVLNYLKHKLSAKLSLPITDDLTLNLAARYCVREGSYIEYTNTIAGSEKDFEPFFIMDCNLNYRYKQFNFYINATNITNKEYFDIGNIPQPQRWIICGLKFSL